MYACWEVQFELNTTTRTFRLCCSKMGETKITITVAKPSSVKLSRMTMDSHVENKCGLWYPIVRVLLAILIVVSIVCTFVWMCSTEWNMGVFCAIVFSFACQYVGCVAVLRENLLMSGVYTCCTITSLIVNGTLFFSVGNLVIGTMIMGTTLAYTYMLYVNGQTDCTVVPPMCCGSK